MFSFLGRFHFKFEPTAWSELVRQGTCFAIIMDWIHMTADQQVALIMFVSAALAFVTRQFSVPSAVVQRLGVVLLAVSVLASPGCLATRPAPMHLTPVAQTAFQNTQIAKNLDFVRDMAVSANESKLLSTDTTRRVVEMHKAALLMLNSRVVGWQYRIMDMVRAVRSAKSAMAPGEWEMLEPYFDILSSSLMGGQQ
jgi:hypothetical protein